VNERAYPAGVVCPISSRFSWPDERSPARSFLSWMFSHHFFAGIGIWSALRVRYTNPKLKICCHAWNPLTIPHGGAARRCPWWYPDAPWLW